MSGLSPHATEFSPGQPHDDYDDDFDDDSFEDDAPQQLSPISEAVPPTTPMSPRDEASLDAREEFIRRWRAKEAEADAGMRVVDQVFGPGRVLELGTQGTTHAGDVRVEYDDNSPSHGVPDPLWRPVAEGLIVPAAGCAEGEADAGH